MKIYRGTQRTAIEGCKKLLSFAPSLDVAMIYSAHPGDVWSRRPAGFLPTSTIHIVEMPNARILNLGEGDNFASFSGILRQLRFGEEHGITEEEARKILNYLHNRLTGRVPGGEFTFKITDEDGDEVEFDFSFRETDISQFRDEHFEWDHDTASQLEADTFIFADAPAVRTVARRLGYDALSYEDVFSGAVTAAPQLLGREVEDLEGVEMNFDIEGRDVPVHQTIRPLHDLTCTTKPTSEILATLKVA